MSRVLQSFVVLSSVIASTLVVAADYRQYTIRNYCPLAAPLYIGGVYQGALGVGATVVKNLTGDAGFFYTSSNGGTTDGAATRAGFYGDNDFYYIVKDTTHFNTGISITPVLPPTSDGFCVPAVCNTVGCNTAYTSPPVFHSGPGTTPPNPPTYRCPGTKGYEIIFCPTEEYPPGAPPAQPFAIHPNGNTNKCLDVRGAVLANGTPVQIYDCNGTGAQIWNIAQGNTKVQLASTNFCLDAGSTPGNGVGMKIYTCYDNLPAQAWYYTADQRIALTGKGQCLDLPKGSTTNGLQVQTYKCTDGDTNQIWTTKG